MIAYLLVSVFSLLSTLSLAHSQEPLGANGINGEPWDVKYGSGPVPVFSGPLSFSHLPYYECLKDTSHEHTFDIAVLGMPFDTATTYRPGARFGPYGIRSGSRRQKLDRSYTIPWGMSPYQMGAEIIDCGDVPITPFNTLVAIDQIQVAYETLLSRPVKTASKDIKSGLKTFTIAKDGIDHPRIVTLGGDHTIVLPILRSLYKIYGPISVIHFDSHVDTWKVNDSAPNEVKLHHGTFFTVAFEEGLMSNASIHAGIRNKVEGLEFYDHDEAVGFDIITTEDYDDLGAKGIIQVIRDTVGKNPVYLRQVLGFFLNIEPATLISFVSFDIDTIDPSAAPATGTPEAGGWSMRETKTIIRGLAGLNFVGADLVEVSPAYDFAELTGIAAADLVHDFLSLMLLDKPPKPRRRRAVIQEEL